MRKIHLIIALFIIVLFLSGCGFKEVYEEKDNQRENASIFVIVEKVYGWNIVYDSKTKVMYAVSNGTHNCGHFTLLVNSDGTPKIWEE